MNGTSSREAGVRRSLWPLALLAGILLAASLSCSVGQALVGEQAAAPPPDTKTPRPTFTPAGGVVWYQTTPDLPVRGALPPGVTVVAPAESGTPASEPSGSTNLLLFATPTAPPQPTAPPTRTPLPPPSATPGPTTPPSPTPYVVVGSGATNGRRGPGTAYEVVGQATANQALILLGRTGDSEWWQVCCIKNQPVWLVKDAITINGAVAYVPVMTPGPTPVPTAVPTRAPTLTPSPTPLPPFDIAQGPIFPIQRDTGIMTIWVKVWEGPQDNQKPLAGYVLKVFRDGVDVSQPVESHNRASGFDSTKPEGNFEYNLKFEMYGAGEAAWEIYLARPNGSRVSPITKFTTLGDSYRNQVVFIGYWLAR